MIEGRAAMLNDTAYLIECFLVRIITLFTSASQELFLLGTFRVEYFQADKSFVHTNGIFPIIGRRGILTGIMDTYSRIFLHLFHQCFLANTTYMMAHEISGLHTFFHFVGNHIAPVASGKSHDESEVTFFVSGKADGKMFLHFQGNVILEYSTGFPSLSAYMRNKEKSPVCRGHIQLSVSAPNLPIEEGGAPTIRMSL